MLSWWHRDVIAAGKLPLMLCFVCFVVTFVSTRTITRLIRDGRGPFRNVTAGGTHVHHSVPGIILLMIGAFTAVGGPGTLRWLSFSAIAVGIGTSLVLDEFALILHLQDVYWSGEGQLSVEAVSLVAACLGLALVGFSPLRVPDMGSAERLLRISATGILVIDACLALVCILKGKYRTGLFGLSCRRSDFSARCGWPGRIRSGRSAATTACGWSTPPAGPRTSTATGNRCRRTGRTSSAVGRRGRTRPARTRPARTRRPARLRHPPGPRTADRIAHMPAMSLATRSSAERNGSLHSTVR